MPKGQTVPENQDTIAGKGHNGGPISGDILKSYIERIERLQEEKDGIAADIRDVFAEAKANGFDVKTMRVIIKERKLSEDDRMERDYLKETYMLALGMLPEFEHGAEE